MLCSLPINEHAFVVSSHPVNAHTFIVIFHPINAHAFMVTFYPVNAYAFIVNLPPLNKHTFIIHFQLTDMCTFLVISSVKYVHASKIFLLKIIAFNLIRILYVLFTEIAKVIVKLFKSATISSALNNPVLDSIQAQISHVSLD